MFNVLVPNYCNKEIQYSVRILLGVFLGLDYRLEISTGNDFIIKYTGKELILPATFFRLADKNWLKNESLPNLPLRNWDVSELNFCAKVIKSKIPVIYGESGCTCSKNEVKLNIDVFGSAFFMLSRYEEIVKNDYDKYGRFSLNASLAFKEGFLDRPIVNEYIEILWSAINYLWPEVRRKTRTYRQLVSCDVDIPYKCVVKSYYKQTLELIADLVKRRTLSGAWKNWMNFWAIRKGNMFYDPNNTFTWMMNVCDSVEAKCAFYFICAHTSDNNIDGCYNMEEAVITNLLKDIASRGHEIGLHPSFESYLSQIQIKKEFTILKDVCKRHNIIQEYWGGRQHYLRWKNPDTFYNWDSAGLNYDSTLTFAEHAGFRCGICYEYPVYDLKNRMELNLVERPLLVMDVSVLSRNYMNLQGDDALEYMQKLKSHCKKVNGDFVLLWHNSNLLSSKSKNLFKNLLLS